MERRSLVRTASRGALLIPMVMRGVVWLMVCGAPVCGAAACGTAAKPGSAVPGPAGSATPRAPAAETPARWSMHPARATNLRARLDLGVAGILYVGDGRERWLDKTGTPATAATSLLPEAIVAVVQARSGKGVLFVGESGAIWSASDPLGNVGDKKSPPVGMRSLAAGKSAILGVTIDGAAMRTTDGGLSWQNVDLGKGHGALIEIALNAEGIGLALFAPQRLMVTTDDGGSWKPIGSPGVGARRLVLDVNGDVILEGLESSAVLRPDPPRMERVARAPKSEGFDLALATGNAPLGYAKSVHRGNGALLGTRYVEALSEPDDPTRWKVAVGPLGGKMEVRRATELNGCERVWIGGDAMTIEVACEETPKIVGGGWSKPSWSSKVASSSAEKSLFKLLRSEDGGKTWKDDGVVGSEHRDSGRLWLTADRALIVDGACKKAKAGCGDSPPLIRLAGAKNFAKIGVPHNVNRFVALAFSPNGARAYALARSSTGSLMFLVSANGGRDFAKATFPGVQPIDARRPAISATRADGGSIAVDESGAIYATVHAASDWAIYASTDEGASWRGAPVPFRVDAVAMVGKRGLAYERHGRGWETADGGATWSEVGAPQIGDATAGEHVVACSTYGCLIGDRATRIGWGATGSTAATAVEPGAVAKVRAATPLKCTVEGEWKSLGAITMHGASRETTAPTAFDADLAPGVRWAAIKHDRAKGSVSVVVAGELRRPSSAGNGKKGALETREIPLFGPGARDTATVALPQLEGGASLRYSFKRAAPAAEKRDRGVGPVIPNQKVDVDVAWWLAATGRVHRATIRGVGPLDDRDVWAAGDAPAVAQLGNGMLSIAQGGIHVRPLASRPDAPLFFVHENGRIDRLSWPELPQKDAAGAALNLRTEAVRVAGRTVLLGVSGPGLELYMAWANGTGTAWETRTWGVWPEIARTSGEVAWDFTYIGGLPSVVAQWPGGGGVAAAAWATPLKVLESDPSEAIALPTQKSLGDPPTGCDGGTTSGPRVVAPFAAGTRHPVIVTGEGSDILLASGFAVLHGSGHGSGQDVCVSMLEAQSLAPAAPYAALIAPGDLAHATLFRNDVAKTDLAARPMACAFSKDAMPSSGLAGAEGFGEVGGR